MLSERSKDFSIHTVFNVADKKCLDQTLDSWSNPSSYLLSLLAPMEAFDCLGPSHPSHFVPANGKLTVRI